MRQSTHGCVVPGLLRLGFVVREVIFLICLEHCRFISFSKTAFLFLYITITLLAADDDDNGGDDDLDILLSPLLGFLSCYSRFDVTASCCCCC